MSDSKARILSKRTTAIRSLYYRTSPLIKTMLTASTLALSLVGTSAAAQFDTTPLFAHGAWMVNHTFDTTDGAMWCSAQTINPAGQTFSVTAYDNGGAAVFVMDDSWSLSNRPVQFRIDIDYQVWTVDGTAHDIGVHAFLNNDRDAGTFIGELGNGSAVAVYNDRAERLGTFSLQGSRAALYKLAECWSRIRGHDPFMNASDPF